jgi:sigma-E factor negative regulatory protein RseC
MIEEIGIVIKVEDATAKVAVQKRGACEGCAASGVCETSESGMEIEALNQAQAKVGQTVKISIKPQVYLKGAIFVYGIPLVAFIAGIIAGKNLGEAYIQSGRSIHPVGELGYSFLFCRVCCFHDQLSCGTGVG